MKKTMMKKLLYFCMIITLLFTSVPTGVMAATEASSQTAKAVKSGWKRESVGYCYYVNGKKLTNQLKKIGSSYYYFQSNGARKTGWYTVKRTISGKTVYRTYYFNSKGASNGRYTTANSTMMKKLDQVISKNKISSSLNTTQKKKDAIKKLYNYTVKNYGYRRVMNFRATNGWHFNYAKEMLERRAGSCYHDAALFGAMVKRATGLDVRVCWGKATNVLMKSRTQLHGWVEVKIGNTWYIYDTNAGRFSKVSKNWAYRKASSMTKYYKAEGKVTVKL